MNCAVFIRVSNAAVSENSKPQLVLTAAVNDKNTFVASLKCLVTSTESHNMRLCSQGSCGGQRTNIIRVTGHRASLSN